MNRALLAELQGQRCYPSVTVLINTTPGRAISGAEAARARELIDQAGTRMDGTTDDAIRKPLLEKLERLLDDHLAVRIVRVRRRRAARASGRRAGHRR